MTDKEQIIVDGIDVSECEDVTGLKYCDGYGDWCYLYPDCSFKKLVRKTQECEKYKKLAADFKDVNKQLGYKYLTIKKECEELKEELTTYKKMLDNSDSELL